MAKHTRYATRIQPSRESRRRVYDALHQRDYEHVHVLNILGKFFVSASAMKAIRDSTPNAGLSIDVLNGIGVPVTVLPYLPFERLRLGTRKARRKQYACAAPAKEAP